jgi:hypothetical protein
MNGLTNSLARVADEIRSSVVTATPRRIRINNPKAFREAFFAIRGIDA